MWLRRLLASLWIAFGVARAEAQEVAAPLAPPGIGEDHNREALGVGRVLNHCVSVYPQREFYRAQEGWVLVEFSVTAEGSVENAKVIASSPQEVFDANAIQGISSCRFIPKTVEGKPVAVDGIRELILFQFEL
jgi:TonB family protein